MPRRDAFELPAGEVYLDGAYCSPLPRAARVALDEAWRLNTRPYGILPEHFFDYPDAVRERVARVLHVRAEDVGVTTSTGFGAMQVAQGIDWRAGERCILGPDEFPSNVYPWFCLRDRGVEITIAGERGRPLVPEDLERALASGPRVRVVAVAAVYYLTGELHPIAELARIAHEHEALLVVDATQAVGSVAIDWPTTGADVVLSSGYKWLLGPYGVATLWVRRPVLERLVDVNGNWWANPQARDFSKLLDYAPIEAVGRRLDSGETANFLNLGVWRVGLDVLLEHGVEAVEAHHRGLQDRLVAALEEAPVRVLTDCEARHRSPMLYLETTGELDATQLQAELAARRIHVSLRGGRIRVSPGIWNDAEDVDALVEALRRVSAAG